MFTVTKQNGEQEDFSREKLRMSLRRSGVATWLVDEIIHEVEGKFARKKKLPTDKLYAFVREKLQKKI